jgi:hypothetical protein
VVAGISAAVRFCSCLKFVAIADVVIHHSLYGDVFFFQCAAVPYALWFSAAAGHCAACAAATTASFAMLFSAAAGLQEVRDAGASVTAFYGIAW